jgi:hypothetical protein
MAKTLSELIPGVAPLTPYNRGFLDGYQDGRARAVDEICDWLTTGDGAAAEPLIALAQAIAQRFGHR